MKLLHLSDSHFSERRRLGDTVAIHQHISNLARERGVDLIVHAGDWFERRSTGPERNALATFIQGLPCPLFGVKGNHDAPEDLTIFNEIETEHPVCIMERPDVEYLSSYAKAKPNVALIGVPWFDRAHIVQNLGVLDREEGRAQASAIAEQYVKMLAGQVAEARAAGFIPIVVGHLMVAGSIVSSGQCLIGTTVELSPHSLFEMGASYVALGHVHLRQEWYGGRVAYCGSPEAHDFGEPEEKGVYIVTIDDATREFVSSEFVPVPSRRIVRLEGDVDDQQDIQGALVRLRLRLTPAEIAAFDREATIADLMAKGAADVKLEFVAENVVAERAPEIAAAQTVADKLRCYMESKGEFSDAAFGLLADKLNVIEAREVSA